jgi:ATP-dependent DNA ligase
LKAYKDTLLRAEIYGERKGRAIPAAELGGLLNATIERSLQAQKAKNIAVKHMVFDVLRFKGKDVTKLPYEQRLKLVQQVVKALPDSFSVPESYRTPAEMRELWREIKTKKHPLSEEGIIAHPTGTGAPTKVKLYPEADVTIEKIFPGEGALTGTAAGGFEYSLPGKPGVVVGRVGTGFGREDRADMWKNPDAWVGRSVRIKAQEQFPSGAYRAPVFIARHEG